MKKTLHLIIVLSVTLGQISYGGQSVSYPQLNEYMRELAQRSPAIYAHLRQQKDVSKSFCGLKALVQPNTQFAFSLNNKTEAATAFVRHTWVVAPSLIRSQFTKCVVPTPPASNFQQVTTPPPKRG